MRLRLSAVSRSRKRRGGVVRSVMVHVALLGVAVVVGSVAWREADEMHETFLQFEPMEPVVSVHEPAKPTPTRIFEDFVVLLAAPSEIAGREFSGERCRRWLNERVRAGVVAAGAIEFVVDTSGLAEPHSWKITCTDLPGIERLMIDAVGKLRFRPAQVEGRKVRRVVLQHFGFVRSEVDRAIF